MYVKYDGEVECVCMGMVWQPGEEKELDEEAARKLVETNCNFRIVTGGEEND